MKSVGGGTEAGGEQRAAGEGGCNPRLGPLPAERTCLFRFQFKARLGGMSMVDGGGIFREQHVNWAHLRLKPPIVWPGIVTKLYTAVRRQRVLPGLGHRPGRYRHPQSHITLISMLQVAT